MRKSRRSSLLSVLLVCAVVLMGSILPFAGKDVSASAHGLSNVLLSEESVSYESIMSGSTLTVKLTLSGCSNYQSVKIRVDLNEECISRAVSVIGRKSGCSEWGPNYFIASTSDDNDDGILSGRTILKCNVPITEGASASVSRAYIVKTEPYTGSITCDIGGDGVSNTAKFSVTNVSGSSADMELVSVSEGSGKAKVTADCSGNTVHVTVFVKDYSPISNLSIVINVKGKAKIQLAMDRAGVQLSKTDKPTPTPTNTPSPTPTPIPTNTPTPVPNATATPTPTPAPNATATPTPKVTATPTPAATEESSTESSEESSSEETSSETDAPLVIAPVTDETSNDETDPPETSPSDPSETDAKKDKAKKASGKSSSSADYTSFIILGVLALLVVLGYLRYSHLAKKEMSFSQICKNFIPIGALSKKNKKERQDVGDTPFNHQMQVKNGYLQKPTVGIAAAQAYRPVRSNAPAAANQQNPQASQAARPNTMPPVQQTPMQPAQQAPAQPMQQQARPQVQQKAVPQAKAAAPVQKAGRQATATPKDPELVEMERRQRIMEQEMNQLFANKNKLPGEEPPKT